jgi:hypothetical protein
MEIFNFTPVQNIREFIPGWDDPDYQPEFTDTWKLSSEQVDEDEEDEEEDEEE